MRWSLALCAGVLLLLPTPHLPAQQRIALPLDTGTLAAIPGWTALGPAELRASSRQTDPVSEPGKSVLQAVVALVRSRKRGAEHVLLHAPGADDGQVRIVNAYDIAGRTTGAALLAAHPEMQKVFGANLAEPDTTIDYLDGGACPIFAVPSVALHFRGANDGLRWHVLIHVVPAGKRTQYFESMWLDGDDDGRIAIETLLRTFDGAEESGPSVLRDYLLSWIPAAVVGVGYLVIHLVRRRQQAAAARDSRPSRARRTRGAGQP